jgi:hypothetical protein
MASIRPRWIKKLFKAARLTQHGLDANGADEGRQDHRHEHE